MNDHLLMMVDEIPGGVPWNTHLYVADTQQQLMDDRTEFVKHITDKFGSDVILLQDSRVISTQGGRFMFATSDKLACIIQGVSLSRVFWHSLTSWNTAPDTLIVALLKTKGTIV